MHLEGQVINLACDDIGGAVNSSVVLPMLCNRLETKFDAAVFRKRTAIHQAVTAFCCSFVVYSDKVLCLVWLLGQQFHSRLACLFALSLIHHWYSLRCSAQQLQYTPPLDSSMIQ